MGRKGVMQQEGVMAMEEGDGKEGGQRQRQLSSPLASF